MDRVPDYAEDAAILQFYHVDSFEDEVWIDDATGGDRTHRETMIEQFSQRGDGPSEQDAMMRSMDSENDLQVQDDSDPLGIHGSIFKDGIQGNVNTAQLREKSTLIISNKSFQPRQFLLQVHKDTSYNDLLRGKKNLTAKVDQHARALRSLVQANFDRFVSAKDTIDHVYEEMKSKQLNEEQEYGTREVHHTLQNANGRANVIYGPIVERRQKGEKVRSTLTILQRYKFFFSLPSSLLESIKQNKYEAAIRDYKRGKDVYRDLKGNNDTGDANQETMASDLNRKVFDKVWAEVTKIVEELQNVLFKMLADPWRSMDEQESTINFLFDLDTTRDPAWFYLNSQYTWIMDLMEKTYQTGADEIKRLVSMRDLPSSIQHSIALKRALDEIHPDIKDFNSDQDPELLIWRATMELVKAMSSLLLRCLPDFWRLSEALIQEKFSNKANQPSPVVPLGTIRRRKPVNLSNVTKCREMSSNIVKLYVEKISAHFSLDLRHSIDPWKEDTVVNLPAFLPANSNTVHASLYLTRIITELDSCVTEVNGVKLGGEEVMTTLNTLMEDMCDMFIRVLCTCWHRDSRSFHLLEEWIVDPEKPHQTTLLQRFHDFHDFCCQSVCMINSLLTMDRPREQFEGFIEPIQDSFCLTMEGFLEGILKLPFVDYKPLNDKDELLLAKKRGKYDVHSEDIRVLLTIRNLEQLRNTVVQELMDSFEDACQLNMEHDRKRLCEEMDEVDATLFEHYMRRKSGQIRDIIRHGILSSGIDWYSITKPKEVHSFVYETLMKFVLVHSQVNSVDKGLTHRVLSRLLETVVNDCLASFRKVQRFGMGGMLQATLEIEFMHQTLSRYVTKAASDGLQSIYKTIEEAYDSHGQSSNSLQSELKIVKQLLIDSRKSTIVQFLCFKARKDSSRKDTPEKDAARLKTH